MNLSKKLKALRKAEGLTQKQVSKLLGCGYSTVQQHEIGLHEPNSKLMQKLCQLYPEYALWLMTDDIDDIASIKNQALKQS